MKKLFITGIILTLLMIFTLPLSTVYADGNTIYLKTAAVPKAVSEYANKMFSGFTNSELTSLGLTNAEAQSAVLADGFCAKAAGENFDTENIFYFPILCDGKAAALMTVTYNGIAYGYQLGTDNMVTALNNLTTSYDNAAEIYVSKNAFYGVTDNDVTVLSYGLSYNEKTINKEIASLKNKRKNNVSQTDIIVVYGNADNGSAKISRTAVSTANQLMNMKPDGNYYLTADIDLTNVKWKPIKNFSGHLDGNGYEITGLTSNTYGLFSTLKSGAVVENVKLTNAYITSKYKTVGGIVSIIQSDAENVTIKDCFVSGLVSSCRKKFKQSSRGSTAGSIVGKNYSASSVISDCYSNAVTASENTIGGIAGVNYGTIESCGFGGQLVCTYSVYDLKCDENGESTDEGLYLYCIGGVCGINYGSISSSFSNTTRSIEVANYYGGIAGILQKNGSITYCVNSSKVYSDDEEFKGGLIVGYAPKTSDVSNCYTKKPDSFSVSNDIGIGKKGTVTYGISDENYGKISSFKSLGSGWSIVNGIPVPDSLTEYINIPPVYEIKLDRLISIPDESVDYGYDEFGDILE